MNVHSGREGRPSLVVLLLPVLLTVLLAGGFVYLSRGGLSVAQPASEEPVIDGPVEMVFVDDEGGARRLRLVTDVKLGGERLYGVVEGVSSAKTLRVVPEGATGPVLAALEVRPRHDQVAVSYRSGARELEQLDGLWKLLSVRLPEGMEAKSVNLAGSFNHWSTSDHPMEGWGDGVYTAVLRLPPGVHYYKFSVQTGEGPVWLNDPASDRALEEPDGHGGMNSAFMLGPDPRRLPEAQPDHVQGQALFHEPENREDLAVAGEDVARVAIRTQRGDVERVVVWTGVDGGGDWESTELDLATDEGAAYDRYKGFAELASDGGRYFFELDDGALKVFYARGALVEDREAAERLAYASPGVSGAVTPEWARDVVWYQIFPERFRNGDVRNDPGDAEYETLVPWRGDWWAVQPGEVTGQENFYQGHGNVWRRRYGGDVQGLRAKLGYLRELGVTALYLNPVFEASSMHKYDATDFRHIDDNFGVKGSWPVEGETDDPVTWRWSESDLVFLDFMAEAKRQGFRVVIDGVFNHVGRAHYAFEDVLKNGKRSAYAGWFEITDWGDPKNWGHEPAMEVHGKEGGIQWKAWDGVNGHLPVFARDEELGLAEGPRAHMLAITRRWMAPDGDVHRGIDGWRLDVANEVPMAFWRDWRKLVKGINPDAFIAGEIWNDASPWLEGDQFDAVMNYRFADAAVDFFVNESTAISATEFGRRLLDLWLAYPAAVSFVQMNLFDSHDTDRLASMFMNPDRPYDGLNRLQDTGPDYDRGSPTDEDYQRMIQAVVCQMTYVGAPMIYYGNEVGMFSPDDPSNRMPMWWADLMPYEDAAAVIREDVFAAHQRLIAIRSLLRPLRRGTMRIQHADDEAGVLVYERAYRGDRVVVAINRSGQTRRVRVELDADRAAIDWLNPAHARVLMPDEDDVDARPEVVATARIGLRGTIEVELGPWGSAIFSPVPADSGEAR